MLESILKERGFLISLTKIIAEREEGYILIPILQSITILYRRLSVIVKYILVINIFRFCCALEI